jgi:hypothetical protein
MHDPTAPAAAPLPGPGPDPAAPRLLPVPCHRDARGALGVLEGAGLPFPVRRLYWLFDVPLGAIRGEHGHRRLEQVLICLNGVAEVTLTDAVRDWRFTLDDPAQALYLPAGLWRRIRFRAPDTVMAILASRPYEAGDYIYAYEDFLAWARAGRPLPPDPVAGEGG